MICSALERKNVKSKKVVLRSENSTLLAVSVPKIRDFTLISNKKIVKGGESYSSKLVSGICSLPNLAYI